MWRPYAKSQIMQPEEDTFRQAGFEVFDYLMGGMVPAIAFAKSKFVEIDKEVNFVVLITHPLCQTSRVYNDVPVIAHILEEMRRHVVGIPLSKCRLFITDDVKKSYETAHMAELPLLETLYVKRQRKQLLGLVPFGYLEERELKIDLTSPFRWHSQDSEIFAKIFEMFSIAGQKNRMERYAKLHNELRILHCPDLAQV